MAQRIGSQSLDGGIVAEKTGRPCGAVLGALKTLVSAPGYGSTFAYDDLVAWVDANIQPPDTAAFWTAVARVCGGQEKPESLEWFARWRETAPVSLEEAVSAVGQETPGAGGGTAGAGGGTAGGS